MEYNLTDCADRALYDLGERLYAFIDALPETVCPEVRYVCTQQYAHVIACCGTSSRKAYERHCFMIEKQITPSNQEGRIICNHQSPTGSPWVATHIFCDQQCIGRDIMRDAHIWTYLGRTMTAYNPVDFALASETTLYSVCLVCSSDGRDQLCGGQACTQPLIIFVSFSRALWAIKRLLPLDITRYVGGWFAAINLSTIPNKSY